MTSIRTLVRPPAALLIGLMLAGCGQPAPAPPPGATDAPQAPAPAPTATTATDTAMPAAPTADPDGRLQGVDVSADQGDIDWAQVKASGVEFAYAKATGGLTINDPKFADNWKGIQAAGLLRGAYHFYYAGDPPEEQVAHFLKVASELGPHDLPPMLDVEQAGLAEQPDIAPAKLQSDVLTYLEALEKQTGRRPVLYTDPAFAEKYLTDPKLSRYPLWIAQYEVPEPDTPKGWSTTGWTLWQYSESGKVPGIPADVDRDVFKGSREQLAALP